MKSEIIESPDGFGYAKDGKIFRKGFLGSPDVEIGIVKSTPEESLQYFINRYSLIERKVDKIVKSAVDNANKGSFLKGIQHLKDTLHIYDAIGNYQPLLDRLEGAEEGLMGLISENRVKNLEVKNALLKEISIIREKGVEILNSIQVKEIKNKWIRTGSAIKEVEDDLNNQFQDLLNYYYETKKDKYEKMLVKIEKFKAIIDGFITRANKLLEPDVDEDFVREEHKQLHAAWRDLGRLPRSIKDGELKILTDILHKVKSDRQINKPKPLKNDIEGLCNDAEKLLKTPYHQVFGKLKDLQSRWKENGMLDKYHKQKYFNRFWNACNLAQEYSFAYSMASKKNPYFSELSEKEQKLLMLHTFVDLYERGKRDLERLEQSTVRSGSATFDKSAQDNININKRRLQLKEKVITDLRQELQALG